MEWRSISNYQNYEVSSTGKIRNKRTGKELSQNVRSGKGYLSVTLYDKGRGRSEYVHRLVALSFVHGHFLFAQVNHIDGDKGNNHCNNLEWCTPQENHDHKVVNHLTSRKGLSKESDLVIISHLKAGKSVREVSRLTGVSRQVVTRLSESY